MPALAFRSPPPSVRLTNGFVEAFDNAVATARTCYAPRVITPEDVRRDEKARALRDRIARETYQAGHHTTLQHATFQFAIENVTRQCLWSFLHSHPFYNSEQVSQRYVAVKPDRVVVPALAEPLEALYRGTVRAQMEAYARLSELVLPRAEREFFRIFPGRRRTPERWASTLAKRAQEVARYVLPVGTFAHLYHTVSGLTLHRYHRLVNASDVPSESRALVEAMVAEVERLDPLFFRDIEDPIPLEETHEARTLGARSLGVGGAASRSHRSEFDRDLGPRISLLLDWSARGEEAVAHGVRSVLGLPKGALSDAEALERVLSPKLNPYLSEALVLTTHGKLTRALVHASYTFQKKLSHTADSQDQRHRMTPGSRPVLSAQFLAGEPDVIVPVLLAEVPEALDLFQATCRTAWRAIEQLLDAGVAAEGALYLLPNAFPIRFLESGELLHFHHKWVHRLCYTAQEEIWRASLEEVEQVRGVHPLVARHLAPPCTLRREAAVTPFCPEGPRFCGLPVWKMELREFERLL
ncbi:MAG TPA: FAD-dependent thymidylate synthase [Myxococcaceae bacterium]|nr:FAD-dependent thymidylate synthase [Myxococcaceae bacterium]